VDQEAHRHRRRVPAARHQFLEERFASAVLVQMEGLRIEFSGKGLDARSFDRELLGAKFLPGFKVLEISDHASLVRADWRRETRAASGFSRSHATTLLSRPRRSAARLGSNLSSNSFCASTQSLAARCRRSAPALVTASCLLRRSTLPS